MPGFWSLAFRKSFSVDARPPATHYHLGGETSGFYAEFLTPLVGSEYDRKQKHRPITEVAGAATQQLRHIELVLNSPWSIHVEHAELSAWRRICSPRQVTLVSRALREMFGQVSDDIPMRG